MLGQNGVGGLMRRGVNPYLLQIHCSAHRLALAVRDVAEKSGPEVVQKACSFFDDTLSSIYGYFSNSPKR